MKKWLSQFLFLLLYQHFLEISEIPLSSISDNRFFMYRRTTAIWNTRQTFSAGKRTFKISRFWKPNSRSGRSFPSHEFSRSQARSHAAFAGVGVVWYRVCLVARWQRSRYEYVVVRVHVFFLSTFVREKREYRTRVRRNRKNGLKNSRKPFRTRKYHLSATYIVRWSDKIVSLCLSKCSLFFCFFISLSPGFVVVETNLFLPNANSRCVCCVTCYMSTTSRRFGTTDLRLLTRSCDNVRHVDVDLVMAERRGCHAASRATQNHWNVSRNRYAIPTFSPMTFCCFFRFVFGVFVHVSRITHVKSCSSRATSYPEKRVSRRRAFSRPPRCLTGDWASLLVRPRFQSTLTRKLLRQICIGFNSLGNNPSRHFCQLYLFK